MSMSDSRKRKLQMLTGSLARGDFSAAGDVLRSMTQHKAPAPAAPMTLQEACSGQELAVALPGGPGNCWLIRRLLEDVSPDDLASARRYAAVMSGARQRFDELAASAELCIASELAPHELLFMDIETCGFSSTAVFLIGTMRWDDGQFVFEQYLARDYAEEPAVLCAFAESFRRTKLLVTFNGKSFDMNMIRERAVFHALELRGDAAPHLDLLHESRRRWRGRLANCRLQTLEAWLTGRRRVGDIPGSAIPDAYHRFVSTADARQIRDILHHNLLDLLTMSHILTAALTGAVP